MSVGMSFNTQTNNNSGTHKLNQYDEEMMTDENVNPFFSNALLPQSCASAAPHPLTMVTEISDSQGQQALLISKQKKARLDHFWKETTRNYLYTRISPVDQEDIDDPQKVAEFAEECCR